MNDFYVRNGNGCQPENDVHIFGSDGIHPIDPDTRCRCGQYTYRERVLNRWTPQQWATDARARRAIKKQLRERGL